MHNDKTWKLILLFNFNLFISETKSYSKNDSKNTVSLTMNHIENSNNGGMKYNIFKWCFTLKNYLNFWLGKSYEPKVKFTAHKDDVGEFIKKIDKKTR